MPTRRPESIGLVLVASDSLVILKDSSGVCFLLTCFNYEINVSVGLLYHQHMELSSVHQRGSRFNG